ncbi:serralysin [Aliiruegeria haliotis]|uniref:Serralysin n=1 Tax=Aliiruegeria haliotis TaxID=1280846 RepID=A0A2T0RPD5_9RHOB|nr:M10 family metallopeptidase [Aliiruegeria haliotis]PRY23011.1 serralysin [Aliiruegeria haliotis]
MHRTEEEEAVCEICGKFNPFGGDWLHAAEDRGRRAGEATARLLTTDQSANGDIDSASAAALDLPSLSNSQIAARLTHGTWNGHRGSPWTHNLDVDSGKGNPLYVDYSSLTTEGKWFAKRALSAWTATTGIDFSTASPPSGKRVQIAFDDTRSGATTRTSAWSNGEIQKASINISLERIAGSEYTTNSYANRTFIHEVGHSLGLGHPLDYGKTSGGGDNFATDAVYANDSWATSVMSYFSQTENTAISATKAYNFTPMVADILGVWSLYGKPDDLRKGDSTYGVNTNLRDYYGNLEDVWANMAYTIVDSGGIDTLNFSKTSQNQRIDLRPGKVSDVGYKDGNMVIMPGTVIESAISGSGNDTLTGNSASNRLEGRAGRDVLEGLAGNDRLLGGDGADELIGGDGRDTVLGGAGNDHLDGGKGQDTLSGGGGNDTLMGRDGNDTLKGEDGRDTLLGGAGGDTLRGNALADELLGGGGYDTLLGGAGNDTLKGEQGNDTLLGGDGADTLIGGDGRDSLDGGDGNDTLIGGKQADILLAGDGTDRLHGGPGNDSLTGGRGTDIFEFTRNGGRDRITDWQDGLDQLDLTGFSLPNFGTLKGLVSGSRALTIDFKSGDTLIIADFSLAEFDRGDVIL